jgi:hypothetical protein
MDILNQVGRVILVTSAEELNIGRISFSDLSKAVVDRYGFMKFPKTLEDWQNPNGAEFSFGRHDGIEISKLLIYARGIALETRVSTEAAERILNDMLTWAAGDLKIGFRARQIHRRIHQSEIVFTSDLSLGALHPILSVLSDAAGSAASIQWKQEFKYETVGFAIGVDESNLKVAPSQFRLERRLGVAFGDKAYYSVAPFQTEQHTELLSRIEAALASSNGRETR